MQVFDPIQKLIAAARGVPEDDRVPYAFEHRVMARIRAFGTVDPLAWWGNSLIRAAGLCVLVALLLGAVTWLIPARQNTVSLPDAVGNVLLATLDNGSDQFESTP